jgi:uncharacterized RDD family membrane protein YckC
MPYCNNCGSELPEGSVYCPKCGTPVEAAPSIRLANWGERFVAWLIDVLILSAMITLLRFFTWLSWPSITWMPNAPTWMPFIDFGTSNIVHFLYWMITEGTYGQSIGKMIMRIKVTRLDGKPANMAQAALESVGKAFLLPLDCILGWLLYPRRRQRLFNYLSQTIVVRA